MKKIIYTFIYLILVILPVAKLSAVNDLPAGRARLTDPLAIPAGQEPLLYVLGLAARGLVSVIGALALFFVVLGGYQLLTSAGSPEKIEAGKKTLFWAILGVALTLLSFVIINLVITLLTGTTRG